MTYKQDFWGAHIPFWKNSIRKKSKLICHQVPHRDLNVLGQFTEEKRKLKSLGQILQKLFWGFRKAQR